MSVKRAQAWLAEAKALRIRADALEEEAMRLLFVATDWNLRQTAELAGISAPWLLRLCRRWPDLDQKRKQKGRLPGRPRKGE